MGKAKSIGGLGFRDLESFCLAMLAKQGWKLIQRPNSLATQVLKLKYLPKATLCHAKLGRRPYFIWRSILEARHLIEESTIWRMGSGEQAKIWKDKWISPPTLSENKVQ